MMSSEGDIEGLVLRRLTICSAINVGSIYPLPSCPEAIFQKFSECIPPGYTPVTRILCGLAASRRLSVNPRKPHLLAQYIVSISRGFIPEVEDTLIIWPEFFGSILLYASWAV